MIWFLGLIVLVFLGLWLERVLCDPWPEIKSYYSVEDEARHYEGVEW